MELPSPDDISEIMNSPFVAAYWPMLVGALVIIVFLMRGYTKTTIPVFLLTLLAQAWHMGLLTSE